MSEVNVAYAFNRAPVTWLCLFEDEKEQIIYNLNKSGLYSAKSIACDGIGTKIEVESYNDTDKILFSSVGTALCILTEESENITSKYLKRAYNKYKNMLNNYTRLEWIDDFSLYVGKREPLNLLQHEKDIDKLHPKIIHFFDDVLSNKNHIKINNQIEKSLNGISYSAYDIDTKTNQEFSFNNIAMSMPMEIILSRC